MKRWCLPLFLGCCSFLGGLTAVALGTRGTPAHALDAARVGERFQEVARTVLPAVISLEAVKPSAKPGAARTTDDSGSGMLVRLPGQKGVFVLTNNHVVHRAAAHQITIRLADNRIVKPTRVWADPESDIAVLALPDLPGLVTVPLGDSDKARIGQWVLALGSPFGLNQTVTHGIVSARGRGQVRLGSTIRIKDFLQTDASINPGSSGGPLVNLEGEVIGINTAIASPSGANSGVSFSIPSNMVKDIVRQLLTHGRVLRGYLGVQLAGGFEAADAHRLGLARAEGALVEGSHLNTPAAEAGLKRYDVILKVDAVAIRNENHFITLISGLPPGQRVRLEVWRERRAVTIDAVVGDWSRAEGRFRPG